MADMGCRKCNHNNNLRVLHVGLYKNISPNACDILTFDSCAFNFVALVFLLIRLFSIWVCFGVCVGCVHFCEFMVFLMAHKHIQIFS